jgi:hypothetical protein
MPAEKPCWASNAGASVTWRRWNVRSTIPRPRGAAAEPRPEWRAAHAHARRVSLPGADFHASQGRHPQAARLGLAKSAAATSREVSGAYGFERARRDLLQGRRLKPRLLLALGAARTADAEDVPTKWFTAAPSGE